MYPVSGPISEVNSINIDATGSRYWEKERYRQTPPYNLVLPYRHDFVTTDMAQEWKTGSETTSGFGGFANANSGKAPFEYGLQPSTPFMGSLNDERIGLQNQLVNKLRKKIGATAELAVTLAERKQAMDMIANRGLQLAGAALALRRGGPVAFVKALKGSISAKVRKDQRQWRKSSKQFSSWWLEYTYGWKPLVLDIGGAIDVLDSPVPPLHVRVSVAKKVTARRKVSDTSYNYDTEHLGEITGEMRFKAGTGLLVTNPNLLLAQRLGFTNPALVAWELVPFSFVIDWFVNVGDYLRNFSELHGLTYVNPYHFFSFEGTSRYSFDRTWKQFESPPPRWVVLGTYHQRIGMWGIWRRRYNYIPEIVLGVRPPWRLSASRALSAISLLVQKGLGK